MSLQIDVPDEASVSERALIPTELALARLQSAYTPAALRFRPEDSPFSIVYVDVTHRCNMACANCFIPNRELPDLPAEAMFAVLRRLPRRVRVRLVGAEPTVRADLPDLIRGVRSAGHQPVVLSNGLKLARPSYVKTLKAAGLRTVYLSLNGGLRDDLYQRIDGLACAERKLRALDALAAARMQVTVGMILVRGCNEAHLAEFLEFLATRREVPEIHLRSVGPIGRYMQGDAFTLDELEALLRTSLGGRSAQLELMQAAGSARDYRLGRQRVQLTEWPDLGSRERGRLAPDGFLEPMFESMVGNDGRY